MSAQTAARKNSASPRSTRDTSAKKRDHLSVVREPRVRHTFVFSLLGVAIAAGVVFLAVSLNALAAGDAVQARQLENEVADAQRQYGLIIAEVAELENPRRIEEVAVAQLGMVPAASPRYLQVDRPLLADGYVADVEVGTDATDPLKPLLSAER